MLLLCNLSLKLVAHPLLSLRLHPHLSLIITPFVVDAVAGVVAVLVEVAEVAMLMFNAKCVLNGVMVPSIAGIGLINSINLMVLLLALQECLIMLLQLMVILLTLVILLQLMVIPMDPFPLLQMFGCVLLIILDLSLPLIILLVPSSLILHPHLMLVPPPLIHGTLIRELHFMSQMMLATFNN
jgi:hypothetical protein